MQKLSFSGYMQAFAAETRRARKERGFTREELARRARVHENTVGMLERGERDLSCISQTRLLAALGCDGLQVESDGVAFSLGSCCVLPRWFWLLDAQPAAVVELMGASIRERRRALGLSIEALAGKAGIHRNSVWNFEKAWSPRTDIPSSLYFARWMCRWPEPTYCIPIAALSRFSAAEASARWCGRL